MQAYSYSAFISYRHTPPDEAIARKLHTYIENYAIPHEIKRSSGRKKMGRVFRDQEELPLSADLGSDIRTALENSEWLICICSPRYLQSHWCMAELDYFISLGRKDHVLVILAEGDPEESFPMQLRYSLVDGQWVEVEPLAGDVRAQTEVQSIRKLRHEKLRILAPMLGVNFDQLRQRARKRRMRMIGAGAAAGFVLLAGFLTYALIKNGQVSRQRDIAVENEKEMLVQRDRAVENEREMLVQRDLAMNNQMQMLIGQANISVSDGDKLNAINSLREAVSLRDTVGSGNDAALRSALEYALYNDRFETIQTVKNDYRIFESMVFSYNDQYLLAISNQSSANLIDAATGEVLFVVARSDVAQLDSAGFTRDDRYFYTVDSWNGYVTLYDVNTGEQYREYDDGTDTAWTIGGDVFPGENGIIYITRQKELLKWDYVKDTCEPCFTLTDLDFGMSNLGAVKHLAQSPDGRYLAIGSNGYGDGMKILSLDDMSTVALEREEKRGYMNISFSADGRFVSAWSGSLFCLWDAATGKLVYSLNNENISGAAVNNDGSRLVVTSFGGFGLMDRATGRMLWEAKNEEASDTNVEALFSPNGKYISVSGAINGIFDAATGEQLSSSVGVAFSHDSTVMLINPYRGTPALLITPESATVREVEDYQEELFTTPRWTQPSKMIYLELKHMPAEQFTTGANSYNRKSYVYISPDLHYAAQTAVDGFIEIFDISDPDNVRALNCLAEHCYYSVEDGMFSGDIFASCGGYDPRCVLFDLSQGKILHVLPGVEYMHACEFSKDGSKIILLCGKSKNVALVYAVSSGSLLYRFYAPNGKSFEKIGFNEAGTEVAAVTADGAAVVGDLYPTLDGLMQAVTDK